MPITAKLKYLRISPRKVRLVADLIRGKRVSEAQALLDFTIKGATKPLKKLLDAAVADARHNFGIKESNLFISKIFVNEGPTLKRVRARAFGRFFPIHKRTSHVELVLDEIETTAPEKRASVEKPLEDEKKKKVQKKAKETKKPRRDFGLKKLRPRTKEIARRIFRRKAF